MQSQKNKSCLICGMESFKIIGKPRLSSPAIPYIDKDYTVVQCVNCSFYFVEPEINFSEDVWNKLYGDEYFSTMTRWWARKRKRDIKGRFDRLERQSKSKIKTFLDIGSGEGYFLIEASRRGWETHGIDISDNRIEEVKNVDISFRNEDLFSANYPDNYFDCVFMDSVLEHVPNPLAYLKEMNRVMKKNGVLYIGVPNEDSLFNDTKKIVNMLSGKNDYSIRIKPFVSPYHINGFTKKTLKLAAKNSNFDVLDLVNFGGHYDFLKYELFTKPFFMQTVLLPIHLIAIPMRKQTYLDAIFRKTSS